MLSAAFVYAENWVVIDECTSSNGNTFKLKKDTDSSNSWGVRKNDREWSAKGTEKKMRGYMKSKCMSGSSGGGNKKG